ncbi:MAG TPA: ribosome maturation factor RimM, partial [Gemmatimonadales bacterium]
MTGEETRHLVVGRLRKPHGLKGDCAVFPLTGDPELAFAVGNDVWLKNLAGTVVAGPLTIARSRAYHRQWLVAFDGHLDVEAVKPWGGLFIVADAATLRPPADGEVYVHELAGFAMQDRAGAPLGLVSQVTEMPSGLMLLVQGPRREFLV